MDAARSGRSPFASPGAFQSGSRKRGPRMRAFALATLLCLGAAMPPQDPDQREDPGTIVVTGKSIAETEHALARCLARQCPPEEDIAASLALAENQFVAGNYKGARTTLLAAAGRNRRYAKQFPVPVAGLLRANARIAEHLGETNAYRVGMIDSIDALKSGLPEGDPRILVQRVEIGDMLAHLGRYKAAEDNYGAVAAEAAKRSLPRIEAFAMLRTAWLWTRLAQQDPATYRGRALRALDALIAREGDPIHRPYAQAARVLKARMLAESGDGTAMDSLIAGYIKTPPTAEPVLLASEPVNYQRSVAVPTMNMGNRIVLDPSMTRRYASVATEGQWIDVMFWIRPDGTTADIEIARHGKGPRGEWEAAVLQAISTRRYVPLALDPADPGVLRVERYTLTTTNDQNITGSRLRQPDIKPIIEMIDLTADPKRD